MKYWLITFQQKTYGRADWQQANEVTNLDPGIWLAGVLERHRQTCESVLLAATPISAAAYRKLKGEL